MKGEKLLGPLEENGLAWLAHVLGNSSAPARALNDLAKRRQRGEAAAIFECAKTGALVVGPCPKELLT